MNWIKNIFKKKVITEQSALPMQRKYELNSPAIQQKSENYQRPEANEYDAVDLVSDVLAMSVGAGIVSSLLSDAGSSDSASDSSESFTGGGGESGGGGASSDW